MGVVGCWEEGGRWRLERVVIRRRCLLFGGRRLCRAVWRSEMGADGGRVRERVGGRPVPAIVVMRTLTWLGAMVGGLRLGGLDALNCSFVPGGR